MSSYQNRNQGRPRSRDYLDRRMDKWIQTGKQVVDGVAGNRPGQKRGVWKDRSTGTKIEKVGRWMEEKIDWFFENDEDWFDDEGFDDEQVQESTNNKKRPLGAISLRAPKALPPRIEEKRNTLNKIDEWPDDESFKINRWQRKNNSIQDHEHDLNNSFQDDRSTKRRNIPRSSRRKHYFT